MSAPTPTQVKRPWRATARTVFAGLIGFAAILPFIIEATGLEPEVYPWLGGILGVAAAVTRIMAIQQVEAWLSRFFPWLAADPTAKGDPPASTTSTEPNTPILGKAWFNPWRKYDERGHITFLGLWSMAALMFAVLATAAGLVAVLEVM